MGLKITKSSDNMNSFMNEPGELIQASERNCIEEYRRHGDINHVGKVFNITNAEVRKVLKQVGIQVRSTRRKGIDSDSLHDVGMTERDFYCDRD